MHLNLHLPHYFASRLKREIGELYASVAFANIAVSISTLFEPIYLHQVLGFTIPQVLLFMAAVYFFYIVLLPLGAKVGNHYGYKHAIVLAIPMFIVYWILLFAAQNDFSLIYWAPLFFALQKALFWPGYHALLAKYANEKQRGREFGVMHAITNFAFVIGPLIGGVISEYVGIRATFAVAAVIYFASAIPLLWRKEVFVPRPYFYKDTLVLYRDQFTKFLGYLAFGEELLLLTIWPIFVYLVLQDYVSTGLLATLGTLAATLTAVYLGKVVDGQAKGPLIKLGALFTSVGWFLKYLATTFGSALLIDIAGRTSKELVFIPLSTVTYERAERSHALAYVVFFEQALAIGKLLAAILAIVIFSVTGTMTSLFVLAAVFSILYIFI